MSVTSYQGLFSLYGSRILLKISQLGNFQNSKSGILLDFGCGNQELKKYAGKMKYVGFDIKEELSDVDNWEKVDAQTIVINHVLMYLPETEILDLFEKINRNSHIKKIIIGVGTQNRLSKLGKFVLKRGGAHMGTISSFEIQNKLIYRSFQVTRTISVFGLTKIYLVEKV
jgi:hypothetical protein